MAGPFNRAEAHLYPAVIGCDEVGRGALCGPVVVSAVFFDPATVPPALLEALDDSKRLPAPRREALTAEILRCAGVAIAAGSAAAIDRRGIRTMTLDAMRRAIRGLGLAVPVLVDGVDIPPDTGLECAAVVGGDRRVPQIAAASIVAKTARDRLMAMLGSRHPAYGWERNAGYGTSVHIAALTRLGPTRHHRHSFAPVAQWRGSTQTGNELQEIAVLESTTSGSPTAA
jgi:ribonuclease HII